jgi:quinoprotein glucose dehydrogenase
VVGPALSWPCGSGGFPPSGTVFYDGDAVPDWRGDLFVGGLASRSLARIRVDGDRASEVERLLTDRNERLRAVAVAPDTGVLHVAVDAGDAPVLALVPA